MSWPLQRPTQAELRLMRLKGKGNKGMKSKDMTDEQNIELLKKARSIADTIEPADVLVATSMIHFALVEAWDQATAATKDAACAAIMA